MTTTEQCSLSHSQIDSVFLRTLSNYVPPERTLARPENTWINARSTFFEVSESGSILFENACERRKPNELEFERVYCPDMTDEIRHAIRMVGDGGSLSKLLGEDVGTYEKIARDFGITKTYHLSRVTTRRGSWDYAFVRNNALHVL